MKRIALAPRAAAPALTPERATAQAAARRELRVLRQALLTGPDALLDALQAHGEWLQRLLGCGPGTVWPYIAWRMAIVERFGLMPELAQLADAEENVMHLIQRRDSDEE